MSKSTYCLLTIVLLFTFSSYSYAQTTVSGTVTDAGTGETLIGANIYVEGTVIGTTTDVNGNFSLNVRTQPPFVLVFSYSGYEVQRLTVESDSEDLSISLNESTLMADEIVVSASRTPETILESPVSIETIGILEIRNQGSASFYDLLKNLKGVDMVTQSITFQSVNVRGFGANGNTRLVQLIDGVDNQAPGLNFPVGNVVGISELDLESVELLAGPSSALYGPNALQGTLLMRSKSPFEYPGLSAYTKLGVNHVDERDHPSALYQDYGLRYAKAFNNKIAFKISASYLQAQDFIGVDTRDFSSGYPEFGDMTRADGQRVYDGVNVYGDNVLNLGSIADGLIAGGGATGASIAAIRSLIPDGPLGDFSPLGYAEKDFVDNTTESMKLAAALHYRAGDNLEIIGQFNYGVGSTVYTSNDRFVLDNFNIWTGRLEARGSNYFVRAYTTQENSGDSYAANTLAQQMLLNNYITPYFQTFAGARTQGASVENSHVLARNVAEQQRLALGTSEFDQTRNQLRGIAIPNGALFQDQSDLWHAEGSYNFNKFIDPSKLGIVAGANLRQYRLNSQGTLFALDDEGNEIDITEFGGYLQLTKEIEGLKLQASGRFDKNENFEGQFSPRATAVYNIQNKHFLRASYQTGFRIPTTQNQFIDLDVVSARLVGRDQLLTDRYGFTTNPVYSEADILAARAAYQSGEDAGTLAAGLSPVSFEPFETEKVTAYEVGYRSTLLNNKLSFDAYAYFNRYSNYIVAIRYFQTDNDNNSATPNPDASEANLEGIIDESADSQLFGANFNIDDGFVDTRGLGVEFNYQFYRDFSLGGNTAYNEMVDQQALTDRGFDAEYNTPLWRFNLSLSNRKLTDKMGFNITYRWQQAYLWESALGSSVIPAFGTMDAQVNMKLPNLKSIIKLGGSNILNERFVTAFGNPSMGAIYYIQITFDEFLN